MEEKKQNTVQLTEDEENDILDAIAIYGTPGTQGSGMIPKDNLGAFLRALKLNPLQKEIDDFIQKFDRDGLGTLNENTLKIIYYRKKKDSDTLDQLLAAFHILDRDRTGFIPIPEFRYYMCRMGEFVPEPECDDIIKAADPDNTGKVNIEKFAKYLMGIKE